MSTQNIKEKKQELLDKLYKPFRKSEKECLLYCSGHTNIVFGEGNPNADIMFIGEAPGKEEDLQGRPFVGRSGELLNKALEQADLSRNEIYITNIVKCRPPHNKTPVIKDIDTRTLNLLRYQVHIIQPKIICSLGSISAQVILNDKTIKITKIHGQVIQKKKYTIIPIYHPAYILRNQSKKEEWFQDLKTVKQTLEKLN